MRKFHLSLLRLARLASRKTGESFKTSSPVSISSPEEIDRELLETMISFEKVFKNDYQ